MNDELLDEGYEWIKIERMGKICRFLFHWNQGREEGFPICCIFRFSIESALQDGKTYSLREFEQNHRKFLKKDGMGKFVPCDVFHHHNLG